MKIHESLRKLVVLEIVIPVLLLFLGIYHGLMQVLFRAGVIRASSFLGLEYYQGLTLHGVVNAIVFTTFFAVAFGNILVVYSLKRDINYRIAWLSFWMMLVGTLLASWAILSGKASVLYTFYPPLKAHPFFYIGAALLIVGSWVAFFNWIPTYISWKRENPNSKTPLAIIGIFSTFIVWLIATVSVAVEVIFLLLPWSLGLTETVNVQLARTLFWFFGHPLVYFWLLPAYVMYYTMLPRVAGGKLYSDPAGRLVFLLFIIFSIPVGTHHQYADPAIGANWKLLHAFFTFAVAIPSFITAFTIAASLEYAGRQNGAKGLFDWLFKLPYFDKDRWLFSYWMTGLIIFIFGGISGIVNASYNMNLVVHNTSWVPGHFHLTVAGPVFLAFIGMSLYLLSNLTGKEIKLKNFVLWTPYLWMIGLFTFSWGMMRGGLHGEPRRTNLGLTYMNPDSPLYTPEWKIFTTIAMIGGIIMFTAFLLYFIAFLATMFSRKVKEVKVEFPIAEAYHDANVKLFNQFKPWIVAALILITIAYVPVLYDVLRATFEGSPPYLPNNPLPIK